jgi:hypothetical protein
MAYSTDENGLPSLQLKLVLKPSRTLPAGYAISFSSFSLKVDRGAVVTGFPGACVAQV